LGRGAAIFVFVARIAFPGNDPPDRLQRSSVGAGRQKIKAGCEQRRFAVMLKIAAFRSTTGQARCGRPSHTRVRVGEVAIRD
jgi:hypothetical protein